MTNYNGQDLKPGSPHTFTDNTPLVFQWLPKDYRLPIPENYLSRLSEWAKIENKRTVKLVINGSGFPPKRRKELEDKISNREFNPNNNIELIDFNEVDLKEYDFSFHLQCSSEIKKSEYPQYTVSQYFKNLYNIPEDQRLPFDVEVDAMRIFMLLALKPPLIYFDFDILPENGTKLGEIKAKQGFLMAEDYEDYYVVENCIIAVSEAGKVNLIKIYDQIKPTLEETYYTTRLSSHLVYEVMNNVIAPDIGLRVKEELRKRVHETFGFLSNGGNVKIEYDNSWMKDKSELYTKEEIAKIDDDTMVASSMQTPSAESLFGGKDMEISKR